MNTSLSSSLSTAHWHSAQLFYFTFLKEVILISISAHLPYLTFTSLIFLKSFLLVPSLLPGLKKVCPGLDSSFLFLLRSNPDDLILNYCFMCLSVIFLVRYLCTATTLWSSMAWNYNHVFVLLIDLQGDWDSYASSWGLVQNYSTCLLFQNQQIPRACSFHGRL